MHTVLASFLLELDLFLLNLALLCLDFLALSAARLSLLAKAFLLSLALLSLGRLAQSLFLALSFGLALRFLLFLLTCFLFGARTFQLGLFATATRARRRVSGTVLARVEALRLSKNLDVRMQSQMMKLISINKKYKSNRVTSHILNFQT